MSNIQKGKEYYHEEAYIAAINAFSKHLAHTQDAEGLYWRALCRFKIDSFEQAINDLDAAIKLRGDVPDFYYERGMNRLFLGDKSNCIRDFDQALEMDPQNPFRYASRAFVKAKFDMIEEAIEDYHKAIDLDPDDAISQNNLGMLYEKLGFRNKAKELFDRADELAGIEIKRGQVKQDEKAVSSDNQKKTEASSQESNFQPVIDSAPPKKTRVKIIQEVFTSKKMFGDFVNFWKQKLSTKKEK